MDSYCFLVWTSRAPYLLLVLAKLLDGLHLTGLFQVAMAKGQDCVNMSLVTYSQVQSPAHTGVGIKHPSRGLAKLHFSQLKSWMCSSMARKILPAWRKMDSATWGWWQNRASSADLLSPPCIRWMAIRCCTLSTCIGE